MNKTEDVIAKLKPSFAIFVGTDNGPPFSASLHKRLPYHPQSNGLSGWSRLLKINKQNGLKKYFNDGKVSKITR